MCSFVTATELMKIYDDKALSHGFQRDDILSLARSVQKEITFQRFDGYALSASDVFSLLTAAMIGFSERNDLPNDLKVTRLYGPGRTYIAVDWRTTIIELFSERVRARASRCRGLLAQQRSHARRRVGGG